MLRNKIERSFEEHKEVYIGVGIVVALAAGVILGRKWQRGITAHSLKGVVGLVKEVNPMFPLDMPIIEIKEALSHIDGATFMDALVTNVDGVQNIITR